MSGDAKWILKAVIIVTIMGIVLSLTGCSASLNKRIEAKSNCENAGGLYHEWDNGIGGRDYQCILADTK
jgi:hypothetical protein